MGRLGPRYRRLEGGAVAVPVYCRARNHLARVGAPTPLGETRGALPPADAEIRCCDACRAAWETLPAGLRPASPADV